MKPTDEYKVCSLEEAEEFAKRREMNNEPVAWLSQGGDVSRSADYFEEMGFTDLIPLYTHPVNPKYDPETGEPLIDGYPLFSGLPHPAKELTETDLILILEVLIDSYDDTNRGFLEYEAMYKNSPMRKARIDGMKRMVDKHTHAIEMVEAILRKAQEK